MAIVNDMLLSRELELRLQRDYQAGKRLPSERILAGKYCCDRGTVRSAIKGLASKGLLESVPRKGHFLLETSSHTCECKSLRKNSPIPNVALLAFGNALQDPHIMDVIGGVISRAARENIHITLLDLSEDSLVDGVTSLESLCPGGDVDGFVLCGKPLLRIRRLIEKSIRPCILLGNLLGENKAEKMRFMRVLSSWESAYDQVGYHLGMNGHRDVMLVCPEDKDSRFSTNVAKAVWQGLGSSCASGEVKLDCVCGNIWGSHYKDFVAPSKELAARTLDSLDSHTALVVACGGILGLEVWKGLLDRGIGVPGDLSIVIAGGRNDHFIETFGIASVFDNGWHTGEVCVEEIAKQLSSRDMNYGVRFTNSQYLSRNTVGPVRNQ